MSFLYICILFSGICLEDAQEQVEKSQRLNVTALMRPRLYMRFYNKWTA